jgi:hypothetical protein
MWLALGSASHSPYKCVRLSPKSNPMLELARLAISTDKARECREFIRNRKTESQLAVSRPPPKALLSQALAVVCSNACDDWAQIDVQRTAEFLSALTDAYVIVHHKDSVYYFGHADQRPVLLWVVNKWVARLDHERDITQQVLFVAQKK